MNNILYIIPARGGSKRLPRKNLLPWGDTTLANNKARQALAACGVHDRVVVSTDSEEIMLSIDADAMVIPRPVELATDEATTSDVVEHAIKWAEAKFLGRFKYVVVLQCTSPLVDTDAIKMCADALWSLEQGNVCACYPDTLRPCGGFYGIKVEDFMQHKRLVGPLCVDILLKKSVCIDIDTKMDYDRALRRRLEENGRCTCGTH